MSSRLFVSRSHKAPLTYSEGCSCSRLAFGVLQSCMRRCREFAFVKLRVWVSDPVILPTCLQTEACPGILSGTQRLPLLKMSGCVAGTKANKRQTLDQLQEPEEIAGQQEIAFLASNLRSISLSS